MSRSPVPPSHKQKQIMQISSEMDEEGENRPKPDLKANDVEIAQHCQFIRMLQKIKPKMEEMAGLARRVEKEFGETKVITDLIILQTKHGCFNSRMENIVQDANSLKALVRAIIRFSTASRRLPDFRTRGPIDLAWISLTNNLGGKLKDKRDTCISCQNNIHEECAEELKLRFLQVKGKDPTPEEISLLRSGISQLDLLDGNHKADKEIMEWSVMARDIEDSFEQIKGLFNNMIVMVEEPHTVETEDRTEEVMNATVTIMAENASTTATIIPPRGETAVPSDSPRRSRRSGCCFFFRS